MAEQVVHYTMDDMNALSEKGTVLVDFWAPWCGPCRMMAPELEKAAEHYGEQVHIAKINIDEQEEAAVRYGVSSIPTLILFRNGAEVSRFVGAQPAARLISAVDAALANVAD